MSTLLAALASVGTSCLKKLAADRSADSPRNCVTNRAEGVVLERCSDGVTANNTSDYLNDEIDKSSRHVMLLSARS